jgi:hypothetical protein
MFKGQWLNDDWQGKAANVLSVPLDAVLHEVARSNPRLRDEKTTFQFLGRGRRVVSAS